MDKNGRTMPFQRTYNLQPRPRSPWQFLHMLELSIPFLKGKNWIAKDTASRNVTQIEYYEMLAADPAFNLKPGKEDEQRARTYLTMNATRLGFCYKDKINKQKEIMTFTPAAKLLSEGQIIEQTWLKQMMKWQIPSQSDMNQHMLKNSFHPFLSAVRICLLLGSLTKDSNEEFLSKWEYAVFVLTMTNDKQCEINAKEIIKLRKKIANTTGKTKKNKVREKYHVERLKDIIYKEDIAAGRFGKRQDPTGKATITSELVRRRKQNENDYTDTIIRFMRATGIFVASDRMRRLRINPRLRWKAVLIDKKVTELFKINKNFQDVEKFYSWFGNTDEPKLPWESIDGYQEEIKENLDHVKIILSTL